MATNPASVNGSTQASAPAAQKAARKPAKTFRRPHETDVEWGLRIEMQNIGRRQRQAATALKRKTAAAARAIRLAPQVAARVEAARARLKARHAHLAATNPRFTASFATFVDFQATAVRNPEARLVYAADNAPVFADLRAQKAAVIKADVEVRMCRGYEWSGGGVGGNGDYEKAPFVYRGLVSDEHPILMAFCSKLPRAKRLRVADGKAETYTPETKLLGLDSAYVEANKSMGGIVRVEIDSNMSETETREACDRLAVPLPNIIVGWKDAAGRYVRPHLMWVLHDSVPLTGLLCSRFRSLFRGVSRGLTKALLSIGADPGGLSNPHRHKSPLSPLWDRAVVAQQPYDLGDLRLHVDITVRMKVLAELAAEMRGGSTPAPVADHPLPEVAAESNRLFAHLSRWARTEVVQLRAACGERQEFDILVADESYRFAAGLAGDAAKSEKAALRCARAVAEWTWVEYKAPQPKEAVLSGEALAARQADGGRRGAAVRRGRSEEVLVAAAVRLAAGGVAPTQVEVLAAVVGEGVRGVRTVRRHWPAIQAAVAAAMACQQADRPDSVLSVKELDSSSVAVEAASLLVSLSGSCSSSPPWSSPTAVESVGGAVTGEVLGQSPVQLVRSSSFSSAVACPTLPSPFIPAGDRLLIPAPACDTEASSKAA